MFTPASKAAAGEHDENISFDDVVGLLGEKLAVRVRDLAIAIYERAARYALQRGIIIADTKFEFGLDDEGTLHLIDEVITPDSSRFWPVDQYRVGISPPRRALEPGMAFTVEPGVYVARTKASVTLSHAPYDIDEVAKLTLELGLTGTRAELDRRTEEAGSIEFNVPAEFLGIGVRIEDDILITADGFDNMSTGVPVDPDEIEAVCAEESSLPMF
jgi:hypothetical protein